MRSDEELGKKEKLNLGAVGGETNLTRSWGMRRELRLAQQRDWNKKPERRESRARSQGGWGNYQENGDDGLGAYRETG